ncbi:MAG: hypothetical protein R2746_00955 [Acidimicrobiales bacterium]
MASLTTVDGLRAAAAIAPVAGFVVTVAAVPLSIRVARRFGVLDAPTDRSSHTVPTPRLGGMAVAVGATVALLAAGVASPRALDASTGGWRPHALVLAVSLLLAAIGLADDLVRGIPVAVRLTGQALVGCAVVAPWVLAQHPSPASARALALAGASALALAGFVNVFNFMDGVDGMSGGVASVMGLHVALLGLVEEQAPLIVIGLAVAGAAAGFLPLNLRPTTVFLGDAGSYFLGGWLAAAAVVAVGLGTPPVAVVVVAFPYLADTSTTLIDRIRRGQDWKASHHDHAYQRLAFDGWSHRAVAGLLSLLTAGCGALGLVTAGGPPLVQALAVALAATVALTYVVLGQRPDLLGRRATPPHRRRAATGE